MAILLEFMLSSKRDSLAAKRFFFAALFLIVYLNHLRNDILHKASPIQDWHSI